MENGKYVLVSGLIFLVVAVAHLYRALSGLPVSFGGFDLPLWVSWIGVVVAGSMVYWGLGRVWSKNQ